METLAKKFIQQAEIGQAILTNLWNQPKHKLLNTLISICESRSEIAHKFLLDSAKFLSVKKVEIDGRPHSIEIIGYDTLIITFQGLQFNYENGLAGFAFANFNEYFQLPE